MIDYYEKLRYLCWREEYEVVQVNKYFFNPGGETIDIEPIIPITNGSREKYSFFIYSIMNFRLTRKEEFTDETKKSIIHIIPSKLLTVAQSNITEEIAVKINNFLAINEYVSHTLNLRNKPDYEELTRTIADVYNKIGLNY